MQRCGDYVGVRIAECLQTVGSDLQINILAAS